MKYILAFLLIAIIIVAGCNGSSENNSENQQPQEQQQNQEQQTPENNAPVEPANNNVAESLKNFFSKKMQLEYMVKYNVNTNANGEQSSSTMTQYIKGIKKIRTDIETQGQEIRTVLDNNMVYACNKATGSWMCLETEIDMSASDNQQAEVEANPENYDIKELPGRTIAGAQTKCFEVTVEEGSVSYCYSSEGVPLYIKSMGASQGVSYTSELTASTYSTTVSDSEFELPAEPGAMPNIGDFKIPSY